MALRRGEAVTVHLVNLAARPTDVVIETDATHRSVSLHPYEVSRL